MHPIDFILRLLSSRITLEQSEYERAHAELTNSFDSTDNVFTRFFRSPYVLIVLPILLPIAEAGLNRLLNWISPPPEETTEDDFFEGLQELINKHRGG